MKPAALALSVGLGLLLLWAALRPSARPDAPAPAKTPPAAEHSQPLAAAPPAQLPAAEAPPPPTGERPLSAIRLDYEREPRDDAAAAAEQVVRSIYAGDPEAAGILRQVRCGETVCRLDARWSRQWNKAYNAALLRIIAAFSNELSFETSGPPDGLSVPMAIFVRRSPREPNRERGSPL